MKTIDLLKYALVLTLALSPACKRDTTGPDNTPKPGKRDYVWTIDTLTFPESFQTLMRDIWASSPTNVYVVGHNDINRGKMYRYDGQRWQPVPVTWSEGGPIQAAIDLSAIYGFGPNDIYAVGERIELNPTPPPNFLDSSLIIRFDGSQWREVQIDRGRALQAVMGFEDGSVLAGGIYGSSYYYKGTQWSRDNADMNIWFSGFGTDGQNKFGLAYTPSPGDYETIYMLRWNDSTWQVLDSTRITSPTSARFGHRGMRKFGNTIYSVGYGVFVKERDGWQKVVTISGTLTAIYGTRPEHIFTVGNVLTVWHFNGQNWSQLVVPGDPTWLLTGVWCTEDEVFIVGHDGLRTFILHGK